MYVRHSAPLHLAMSDYDASLSRYRPRCWALLGCMAWTMAVSKPDDGKVSGESMVMPRVTTQ